MVAPASPIVFESPDGPLTGYWHAADGRTAPAFGVVLCAPWGREAVCAHATLRHLAGRLAEAGLPVLRFDAHGCGDASGSDTDADRVGAWRRSIHSAADALRHRAGVAQVALVGLRLGATLALQAASERDDVTACVALMPIASGRRHLRELQALRGQTDTDPQADWDVGGFVLTAETREALGALDLAALAAGPRVPAGSLLVIERDDLPSEAASWCASWQARGVMVRSLRIGGYDTMMLDPHLARVPRPMCHAVTTWLEGLRPADGIDAATVRVVRSADHLRLVAGPGQIEPALRVPGPGGRDSREVVVRIPSPSGWLHGVLATPADGAGATQAILILNAGATRRIGPGRLWVAVARRLAPHGAWVLRLDLAGLGDSPAAPGAPDGEVYAPGAVAQALAALRFLRAQVGDGVPLRLLGLCAGAYHGLRTALATLDTAGGAARLVLAPDRVIAINPLTFDWRPGMRLDTPLPAHRVAREMARYRERLLSAASWRRLLRGGVDLRHPLRVVARSGVARLHRLAGGARPGASGQALRQLDAAGVRLVFLLAEGEPGEALLRAWGGREVDRLQASGRLAIMPCPGADHTFTTAAARQRLLDRLVALLPAGTVTEPLAGVRAAQ
jgi:dienelactone hydrolase